MAITKRQVRKATKRVVKKAEHTRKSVAKGTRSAVKTVKAAAKATRHGLVVAGEGLRHASDAVVEASRNPKVRKAAVAVAAVGAATAVTVAARRRKGVRSVRG